jgi:hypothetical protein
MNMEKTLTYYIHNIIENPKNKEDYRTQYDHSYPLWGKGGRAWEVLEEGGTGVMRVLLWYHHYYKPTNKEWRPAIIIKALREEYQKWLLKVDGGIHQTVNTKPLSEYVDERMTTLRKSITEIKEDAAIPDNMKRQQILLVSTVLSELKKLRTHFSL